MRTACLLLTLSAGVCHFVQAQTVAINGVRVAIDNQPVVGASFDQGGHLFFVQQLVESSVEGVFRTHRRVSSWSTDRRELLMQRDFDLDPPQTHLNHLAPCGNIGVASEAKIIVVCRLDSIEMLDATTLKTVRKIAVGVDEKTYEISVDEARNTVLILSGRSGSLYPLSYSGSLWLSLYSLTDGLQRQTVQFGSLGLVDHAGLAVDMSHGRVAISVAHRQRTPWSSDIYICREDTLGDCAIESPKESVSQMIFVGNRLLFLGDSPNARGYCVKGIDLGVHSISQEYCAPETGVRYTFGIVDRQFVVAFSGSLRRAGRMSENFVDKENTFALWKVGNSHVVGASKFLLDTDVVQQSMRVVASSTSPMFLAYADSGQEHPAELDLYMIVSSDGK